MALFSNNKTRACHQRCCDNIVIVSVSPKPRGHFIVSKGTSFGVENITYFFRSLKFVSSFRIVKVGSYKTTTSKENFSFRLSVAVTCRQRLSLSLSRDTNTDEEFFSRSLARCSLFLDINWREFST